MLPLLLRADNFTPPSRTPWGGTRILRDLKREAPIAADKSGYAVVGESWEVSVEPDFPSRLADGDESLADRVARTPAEHLGREHRAGRSSTALLVKLLDAAEALSVQIHPGDDYAGLRPDESGKPESWYCIAREPGSGVYLGLAEGVTEGGMADALASGGDVSRLLGFVPVEPGDFLLIDAGTAHAIGGGVTLVEPQRVVPGRRGVTYRYWDWNRRYDPAGSPDPRGQGRALHVRDALAVTRWDAPRGRDFLAHARVRPGPPEVTGPARYDALCGAEGPLRSGHLQVARIHGDGALTPAPWDTLVGLTVVEGAVTVFVGAMEFTVERGRSAVLPAAMGAARLRLHRAHAVLSAVY